MGAIRNSAKALIVREGRLLTIELRDAAGSFFVLPGGGQEPGETLADAVRRECREELGAEVVVHELRFVREYLRDRPHRVEFIFRCTLAPGAASGAGARPDGGQVGLVWLPLAGLRHARLYPLGLRPLLDGTARAGGLVYLGDLD